VLAGQEHHHGRDLGGLVGLRSGTWAMRWKPALNGFAITFGDRFPAAETY
jgi:hypothetical protein